jgi:hypothetical protein
MALRTIVYPFSPEVLLPRNLLLLPIWLTPPKPHLTNILLQSTVRLFYRTTPSTVLFLGTSVPLEISHVPTLDDFDELGPGLLGFAHGGTVIGAETEGTGA